MRFNKLIFKNILLNILIDNWTSLTLQDSERSHKLTLQRRIYDTEETQIPERV